ncbi:MAG TPA: 50S ribosomal protein L10 [candidate division Zixibacteria bacterium]|nr:50S ribosomal protein L10 [candidate division Zixibacteria bacterium]
MSKVAYVREPCAANKKQLEDLVSLLGQYTNIGITKVENIASKTIQRIRFDIRGETVLRIAKNTLMKLAIEEAAKKDKGLNKLLNYITGSCAFILTNGNPFKIANFLEKKKIPTAAKEGQIAPKEIFVTARDTGFAPGPVIGELQSIGLKTRIEGGTVKIIEDSIVCQSGEKISKTLANVLGRLGIEPFDAGLSVDVLYTKGELILHDELIIDFDGIMSNLIKAHQEAFNLSIEAAIPSKENLPILLSRTRRHALSLAIETSFITPETAGNILAKSQLEAMLLAKAITTRDPSILPPELLAAYESTTTTTQTTTTTTTAETTTSESKEEEDEDEDSGMSSLFG